MSLLRQARLWNHRRFITITRIAVLPAYLLLVFWRWWANTDPHVMVPEPVMPVPNAHDTYVAAAKGLVRAEDIRFAVRGRPYKGHLHTLQEKEALVRANAPVLRAARPGLAQVYHAPPTRSFSTDHPYLRSLRYLGSAFNLEGQVKAAHGDYAGAMDSYLDAVQYGGDLPRGATVMGFAIGASVQAVGRRPAWDAVPHLNAAAARRAARRMEAIDARAFPVSETLREEMWCGQAAMYGMFWPRERSQAQQQADKANPQTEKPLTMPANIFGNRAMFNNYTRYMEKCIEQARRPYAASGPDPKVPLDPINRTLLPGTIDARFWGVQSQTQNRLLAVALALQAYRAEHGRYPAALSELTPSCLKAIPDDPFALNAPLRYRQTGDGKYVLYSVGPDGRDDGGRAIDDPAVKKESRQRHSVIESSKGDVVAGINR